MFSVVFAQSHPNTDMVAASVVSLFQLIINGKMQVKGEALKTRYRETDTLQTTKPEKTPVANLKRLSLRQERYSSFERTLGALEKILRNNRLVGKIH